MSNKISSTAVYIIILTIGALFVPLQFGFANTNTSAYHLQAVVGHICDQTRSTAMTIEYHGYIAYGCSISGNYRAVQDTQNTVPDTNSNSSESSSASSNFGTLDDRRHETK